jgi:hypothetical protein
VDIVYICRPGDNEELRYSIRSISENMPHDNIWLVGSKPKWFNGNFIPVIDGINKFENIKNCIRAASESKEISSDFVLMNDDFFLLKKIDHLPDYNGGSLKTKVEEYQKLNPSAYYTKLLANTLKLLNKLGYKDPIDYDIHVPMIMNKEKLKIALTHSYSIRSVYGNMFDVGGEKIRDVKVYGKGRLNARSYDYLNSDFPFVSTIDESFNSLYETILKEMFSSPSIYES